jgi:hypothetical protein
VGGYETSIKSKYFNNFIYFLFFQMLHPIRNSNMNFTYLSLRIRINNMSLIFIVLEGDTVNR